MNFWWLVVPFNLLLYFLDHGGTILPFSFNLKPLLCFFLKIYFWSSSNEIISLLKRDIDLQSNKGNKIFSCHPKYSKLKQFTRESCVQKNEDFCSTFILFCFILSFPTPPRFVFVECLSLFQPLYRHTYFLKVLKVT